MRTVSLKAGVIAAVLTFVSLASIPDEPEISSECFSQILTLVQQRDFFSARRLLADNGEKLSRFHRLLVESFVCNAFNKPDMSNSKIDTLLDCFTQHLPDTLKMELHSLKLDNSVKLFDYRKAKIEADLIIREYQNFLSKDDIDDYKNSLAIWSTVEQIPPQQVNIMEDVAIKMKKDKAGLNTIPVSSSGISIDFIFDTGANLSTISRSNAKKFSMELLPGHIDVLAGTGKKVDAQLACCKTMTIDNVQVRNALFLVFNDSDLAISGTDYSIQGIIGYPVITALKEIQISREGYLRIPKKTTSSEEKNLAFVQMTPIIEIDGLYYNFDTGANKTMLFKRYFDKYKADITKRNKEHKIQYAGIGGMGTYNGYYINFSPSIQGKEVILKKIAVILQEFQFHWKYMYGNIGKDLINKFEKVTLNFDDMYVKFHSR